MSERVIELRRMTVADVPFAMELKNAAGWNQVEADWLGYMHFEPEGCYVAEVGGRLAGTATAISYEGRVGWIGMVLVHPDFRRMGIGTALLRHTIGYLRQLAIPAIKLDATPMGKQVYIPLGFHDEYEVTRFEGVALADTLERVGTHVAQLEVVKLTRGMLPEIEGLDKSCFGVSRAKVLRGLQARAPEWCWAVLHSGCVAGYLMAHAGLNAVQLGPCAVGDHGAAELLIAYAMQELQGQRVFMDVPHPNSHGLELMTHFGLTVQRGFTRMVLGDNLLQGRPWHIYATSGAEKG